MIRNTTIFYEHFRFFVFDWNAMLNCVFNIHVTITFHNFKFMHSIRRKQFTIITIFWIRRNDDFVIRWNEIENINFDTYDNFVNFFCNDNQSLRIECCFNFFAKSFVFSKVWIIIRFETTIFKFNRQKNKIARKKQQYFDDVFMISKYRKFSNVVIFDFFVFRTWLIVNVRFSNDWLIRSTC